VAKRKRQAYIPGTEPPTNAVIQVRTTEVQAAKGVD
jgi:hypothetical protein